MIPSAAVAAFQRSCAVFAKSPGDAAVGPQGIGGAAKDWQSCCAASRPPAAAGPARKLLRAAFHALPRDRRQGHAKGCSPATTNRNWRVPGNAATEYSVPLYRRPADLVMVDLGEFRADLSGNSIAGRVVDGRLKSYATRADIDAGALAGQGLELLWVADPVDAFFLQVQGSGRIRLAEGGTTRVGFAAHNGHGFVSVGRILVHEVLGGVERGVDAGQRHRVARLPDPPTSLSNGFLAARSVSLSVTRRPAAARRCRRRAGCSRARPGAPPARARSSRRTGSAHPDRSRGRDHRGGHVRRARRTS